MDGTKERLRELELYIHIPFCVQKCKYCDFLSAPAGRQVQSAYMEALLREVRGRAGMYQAGSGIAQNKITPVIDKLSEVNIQVDLSAFHVVSIFVGGGTPSLVEPEWISRLMDTVRQTYDVDPDVEITMEINPGTVTRENLAIYKQAGVNRLSIGLQSADDDELRQLGRIHDYRQFLDTYIRAREAGFSNINVDLMSAIPGQTAESWKSTLKEVVQLRPAPEHISAYSLIVEEGTPFFALQEKGLLQLPDEETERRMYWDAVDLLKSAGYKHYEISNFARGGYECRHNCGYWRRREYLGFGTGAASLINNVRFKNCGILEKYMEQPLDCQEEIQILSRKEQMEEMMFLGLRMADGIDRKAFEEQYGMKPELIFGEAIARGVREGLLKYSGDSFCLTERGIDVSNVVMARFLLD